MCIRDSNSSGQIDVPALKNPIAVAAGSSHSCAIDSSGVKCWGSNGDGQTNVPFLKEPRAISSGYTHTCALHSEGVKCWGYNQHGQATVPSDLELDGVYE